MVDSAEHSNFVDTIARWLQEREFVFIASHFGAGDRDYCIARSIPDVLNFLEVTAAGYPLFYVAGLRDLIFPMQGVVDADFIQRCIKELTPISSVLVLNKTRCIGHPLVLGGIECNSEEELIDELNYEMGNPVAIDDYPEWDDNDKRDGVVTLVFKRVCE